MDGVFGGTTALTAGRVIQMVSSEQAVIAVRRSMARSPKPMYSRQTIQAICDYRCASGPDGPLYPGKDTHAVSQPVQQTTLEENSKPGRTVALAALEGKNNAPEFTTHRVKRRAASSSLSFGIDRDYNHAWIFAGGGKRLCVAVGCCSEG